MIDAYVSQSKELAFRVIDEEAIVLTPEDGLLHNLNPVATRIFELSNGNNSVSAITKIISEEFDVDSKVAERDVADFIEDLVHGKMLVLSEKPVKNKK